MNTTAQIKQAVKKSAQQIVSEPLELLKDVKNQVTKSDDYLKNNQENHVSKDDPSIENEEKYKKQVVEQDGRHLMALESELKDIRRQKLFNELSQKIQNGVDVFIIEEFGELSHEQKDVLKAQLEAFKKQQTISMSQSGSLREPAAKKGRRLGGFGQKQVAERQQTRVEKPIPPSG